MFKHAGFTLIEMMITLIVVSILGSMMYSFFNPALTHGVIPLINLQKSLNLHTAMEKITQDYHDIINGGGTLDDLLTKLTAGGPPPAEGDVWEYANYGSYGIIDKDFIKFVGNIETPIAAEDPKNILKITIKNEIGETLTALFTDPNL